MDQNEQRLKVIRALIVFQLVGAVTAGLVGLLWGPAYAINALSGGMIAWLPACYFAYRAFRYRGARAARQIVNSFYSGMAGKLILTMALFSLVFARLEPLRPAAVFAGFIAVQMLNWIVPLLSDRQRNA